jgi:hypothetical protein
VCGLYLIGLCEQEQAAVIEGAAGVEISKDTQVCVMCDCVIFVEYI